MNPQLLMGAGYVLAGAILALIGVRGFQEIQKRRGPAEAESRPVDAILGQLERMEQEWRRWRERIDRAVFHADGHVHLRIHTLEGDVAVQLQNHLQRIALLERDRAEDRIRHEELRTDLRGLRDEIGRLGLLLAEQRGEPK